MKLKLHYELHFLISLNLRIYGMLLE